MAGEEKRLKRPRRCRDCYFGRADADDKKRKVGKIVCIVDPNHSKHVSSYAAACEFFREDRRHIYRGWGVFYYVKKKRKPKRDSKRSSSKRH